MDDTLCASTTGGRVGPARGHTPARPEQEAADLTCPPRPALRSATERIPRIIGRYLGRWFVGLVAVDLGGLGVAILLAGVLRVRFLAIRFRFLALVLVASRTVASGSLLLGFLLEVLQQVLDGRVAHSLKGSERQRRLVPDRKEYDRLVLGCAAQLEVQQALVENVDVLLKLTDFLSDH